MVGSHLFWISRDAHAEHIARGRRNCRGTSSSQHLRRVCRKRSREHYEEFHSTPDFHEKPRRSQRSNAHIMSAPARISLGSIVYLGRWILHPLLHGISGDAHCAIYRCFSQSLKKHSDVLFLIDPAASPAVSACTALAKRILSYWFVVFSISYEPDGSSLHHGAPSSIEIRGHIVCACRP